VPAFCAPEWGIGKYHIVALGDVADILLEGIAPHHAGGGHAVKHHVHEAQEGRQRLLLLAKEGFFLQGLVVFQGTLGFYHEEVGLSQEATGATGRVVNGLADLGGDELHHKAHHRSRRVELAGQPVLAAQMAEELFIHLGDGENVVLTVEVDTVDDGQDILEVVTRGANNNVALGKHAADRLAQRIASQTLKVGNQPAVDELQQAISGPVLRSPRAPAQVAIQNAGVGAAGKLRLSLPLLFLGVQEPQEEQPGQMLDVFHDATAVVVAAQDVAGPPDFVGKGFPSLRPVHAVTSSA